MVPQTRKENATRHPWHDAMEALGTPKRRSSAEVAREKEEKAKKKRDDEENKRMARERVETLQQESFDKDNDELAQAGLLGGHGMDRSQEPLKTIVDSRPAKKKKGVSSIDAPAEDQQLEPRSQGEQAETVGEAKRKNAKKGRPKGRSKKGGAVEDDTEANLKDIGDKLGTEAPVQVGQPAPRRSARKNKTTDATTMDNSSENVDVTMAAASTKAPAKPGRKRKLQEVDKLEIPDRDTMDDRQGSESIDKEGDNLDEVIRDSETGQSGHSARGHGHVVPKPKPKTVLATTTFNTDTGTTSHKLGHQTKQMQGCNDVNGKESAGFGGDELNRHVDMHLDIDDKNGEAGAEPSELEVQDHKHRDRDANDDKESAGGRSVDLQTVDDHDDDSSGLKDSDAAPEPRKKRSCEADTQAHDDDAGNSDPVPKSKKKRSHSTDARVSADDENSPAAAPKSKKKRVHSTDERVSDDDETIPVAALKSKKKRGHSTDAHVSDDDETIPVAAPKSKKKRGHSTDAHVSDDDEPIPVAAPKSKKKRVHSTDEHVSDDDETIPVAAPKPKKKRGLSTNAHVSNDDEPIPVTAPKSKKKRVHSTDERVSDDDEPIPVAAPKSKKKQRTNTQVFDDLRSSDNAPKPGQNLSHSKNSKPINNLGADTKSTKELSQAVKVQATNDDNSKGPIGKKANHQHDTAQAIEDDNGKDVANSHATRNNSVGDSNSQAVAKLGKAKASVPAGAMARPGHRQDKTLTIEDLPVSSNIPNDKDDGSEKMKTVLATKGAGGGTPPSASMLVVNNRKETVADSEKSSDDEDDEDSDDPVTDYDHEYNDEIGGFPKKGRADAQSSLSPSPAPSYADDDEDNSIAEESPARPRHSMKQAEHVEKHKSTRDDGQYCDVDGNIQPPLDRESSDSEVEVFSRRPLSKGSKTGGADGEALDLGSTTERSNGPAPPQTPRPAKASSELSKQLQGSALPRRVQQLRYVPGSARRSPSKSPNQGSTPTKKPPSKFHSPGRKSASPASLALSARKKAKALKMNSKAPKKFRVLNWDDTVGVAKTGGPPPTGKAKGKKGAKKKVYIEIDSSPSRKAPKWPPPPTSGKTYKMVDYPAGVASKILWPRFLVLVLGKISCSKDPWSYETEFDSGCIREIWDEVYGETPFAYEKWEHVTRDVVRQRLGEWRTAVGNEGINIVSETLKNNKRFMQDVSGTVTTLLKNRRFLYADFDASLDEFEGARPFEAKPILKLLAFHFAFAKITTDDAFKHGFPIGAISLVTASIKRAWLLYEKGALMKERKQFSNYHYGDSCSNYANSLSSFSERALKHIVKKGFENMSAAAKRKAESTQASLLAQSIEDTGIIAEDTRGYSSDSDSGSGSAVENGSDA